MTEAFPAAKPVVDFLLRPLPIRAIPLAGDARRQNRVREAVVPAQEDEVVEVCWSAAGPVL